MKTLGIIGGLGPMATAYLMELIIEMTDAQKDQEHIDMLVLNRPSVPDRTTYILDQKKPSPVVPMLEMAHFLEKSNVSYIATPCITSHFFYDEIASQISVPMIHMVNETAVYLKSIGRKKIGIMATTGTIKTELFQTGLNACDIECLVPSDTSQSLVMDLIYKELKAGLPIDESKFDSISNEFISAGCDGIILGCTELSLIKRDTDIGAGYLDAMEVLAKRSIELCGKSVKPIYQTLLS